jgi:hypothetical protein
MPGYRIVCLAASALVLGQGVAGAQEGAPQPTTPAMYGALEKSRAAIIECRERRLRKELPSYKASADCSNPKIFAAWRDANYPHMDLITEWLNTREQDSEKVDQHAMSPREFEDDMDALTLRLTTEEHRRRVGMIISSDGDMRLQLPPASQVVGVAVPPGEEKLEAKKAAAARERAASAAPAPDPGSRPSVGSMGQLSALDGDRTKPTPVSATGEGGTGLYAQVAAQRSEQEARSAFRYLQNQYASVLGGRDAVIRRVQDSNNGTYFRVEVGPLTDGQADQLCGTIKAGGGQCIPRFE